MQENSRKMEVPTIAKVYNDPNNVYSNGLTPEMVSNAKAILDKVNVSELCRKNRVNISTIYNVLRDTSRNVKALNTILKAAKKELEQKENVLSETSSLTNVN